jgi:hypothetical protein
LRFDRICRHPLPVPVPASRIHSVHVRLSLVLPYGVSGRVGVIAAPANAAACAAAAASADQDEEEDTDHDANALAGGHCWRAPPWPVVGDASESSLSPSSSPFSSSVARRVGSVSTLARRDDGRVQTVRLSFHAPGDGESAPELLEAAYHVRLELELPPPPARPPGWREATFYPRARVSVLAYDGADRSLSKAHAALSRAGALPAFPRVRGGSEATDPPPGLLSDLLLANCRLLRRRLELAASASRGSGTEPASGAAAAAAAAADLLGSEVLSVFGRVGVDVTEPALRAVEELLAVNRRRHGEHWDRVRAEADEMERRRKRKRRRQEEEQGRPLPAARR